MKRSIAWILAALLTASAFTACTPLTEETDSVETDAPETDAPEVTVNAPLLTENGEARAHIVVAEGADQLLNYGAEELAYHIQKVSGATLTVTNEAGDDSLAIVIGTPDTNPELNELFPEDIAWLTTLEEDGKRYGSDGFAVRLHENTLYIFGITPRGALNGVYDFMEDNMGILWIRANEDIGTIYDEMPTVAATKADYREKSPFEIRGWTLCGAQHPDDFTATQVMLSRNKMNAQLYWENKDAGIMNYHLTHNLKYWLTSSTLYDPNETEYWCTDEFGNLLSPTDLSQINFWSDLALECVVESVLRHISTTGAENVGIGIEDSLSFDCLPMSGEPFEYAPGQFVEPSDNAYRSTVFFTFLNEVARRVKEVYPDVTINTYAYQFTEPVPLCDIEDNIGICIAPILEDMTAPVNDTDNMYNVAVYELMEAWKTVGVDVTIYNYYGCSPALSRYERPICDRIQADLRYYVECGFTGLLPEGLVDADSLAAWAGNPPTSETWDLNTLTYWLYGKLAWNPEEDVEALIVYFCDKVYGAASEKMQEYYRVIKQGWDEAEGKENYLWNFKHDESYYFDTFVYGCDLEADIIAILREAYDAADTELAKERIRPIKESYEEAFPDE